MKKSKGNIKTFELSSLGGLWHARFIPNVLFKVEFRDYGDLEERLFDLRVEDWLGWLPLRRTVADQHGNGNIVSVRSAAASIQLFDLSLRLPPDGNQERWLHLDLENAPPTEVILDHPYPQTTLDEQRKWKFLVTKSHFRIPILNHQWPKWVEKAVIITDQMEHAVEPEQLIRDVFQLQAGSQSNSLEWRSDSLLIEASREIPWQLGNQLDGVFRYDWAQPGGASQTFRVSIGGNSQWQSSLKRYQLSVIKATQFISYDINNNELSDDTIRIPGFDSPAVGVVSANFTKEIIWYNEGADKWTFVPPVGLFELEIRGAGGGVARLIPEQISMKNGGLELVFSAGTEQFEGDLVEYSYERGTGSAPMRENVWKADFKAIPEADSIQQIRNSSGYAPVDTNNVGTAWIVTESGPMGIPLLPGEQTEHSAGNPESHPFLKGLLRLAEIPWESASEDEPLVPRIGLVKMGSLLLLSAKGFSCTIELANIEQETHPILVGAKLYLVNPQLRLEDFLPVYIPPKYLEARESPPELRFHQESDAESSRFFGLTFLRGLGQSNETNQLEWEFNLRFHPARESAQPEQNRFTEGDWGESTVSVFIPENIAAWGCYWYKPPNLCWVPALPLSGNPANDPENRINETRTLMPLLPNSNGTAIEFSFGETWHALKLKSGLFSIPPSPNPAQNHGIYRWVPLELPGLEFELLHGELLRLENGLPVGGRVNWNWRHDLPVLDELFALRLGEQPGKKQNLIGTAGADSWPGYLADRDALAKVADPFLFRREQDFVPELVFEVSGEPVILSGLFSRQTFEGKASLSIWSLQVRLNLLEGNTEIPLIPADRLLEGPGAHFQLHLKEGESPVLKPTLDAGEETWQMKAGTLVPKALAGKWVDQRGRINREVSAEGPRSVQTHLATEQYGGLFQWNGELDLGSSSIQCHLRCIGLPVTMGEEGWQFRKDELPEDIVFHEFRWGAVGPVLLWGFPFQIYQLEYLRLESGIGNAPETAMNLGLAGVLHYRSENIRAADPERQVVHLELSRDASGDWKPTAIHGEVFWPLFAQAPDLADAISKDLREPFPWVNSKVALEGGLLVFKEASVSFQYLERNWRLPLKGRSYDAVGGEAASLIFEGEAVDGKQKKSALVPYELRVELSRSLPERQSKINFNLAVNLANGANDLVDAELTVAMDANGVTENLSQISLLQSGDQRLWGLDQSILNAPVTYSFSNGKLAFVLNRPARPGDAIGRFQLLPGMVVAQREAIYAFVTIQLQPPGDSDVQTVTVKTFQVLIESKVRFRESQIDFRLLCSLDGNGTVSNALDFTGDWTMLNLIAWPGKEGEQLEHEISFLLRQARISNDLLLPGEGSFFVLELNGNQPFVEWPCIARHRILDKNDRRTMLTWTAPQRLRLFSPETFVDTVLIRPGQGLKGLEIQYGKTRKDTLLTVQHKFRLKPVEWEKIERGFSGAFAEELAQFLKGQPIESLLVEASEAFWLWPNAAVSDRPSVELWRSGARKINGIPTSIEEFRLTAAHGDDHSGDGWYRMAIPFVSSVGHSLKHRMPASLRRYMANIPGQESGTVSTFQFLDPNMRISLPGLLRQRDLPKYSLDHAPVHPGYGRAFDQVLPSIEAYERIFPYTQSVSGFEQGWLVFAPWHLGKVSDPYPGMAFGMTKMLLDHLIQVHEHGENPLVAAWEVYPTTQESEALWKRVRNSDDVPVPYLIASPLLSWEKTWNIAQIPEWKSIKGRKDLSLVSESLVDSALGWINRATAVEINSEIIDGPGGHAPEGDGIGALVARRMTRQKPANGYTSLRSLLRVKGMGLDKLSDLLWKAIPKPQRVLVEVWLPGTSDSWTNSVEPLLVGREVARLGRIEAGTQWEDLLFDTHSRGTNVPGGRAKLWDWVATQIETHRHRGPLLIRASRLEPHSELDERYYRLLEGTQKLAIAPSGLRKLSVPGPAQPDSRLESFAPWPKDLVRLPGPDYLDGRVYYERLTWSLPPELAIEELGNGSVIVGLEASPKLVKRGEEVSLDWQLLKSDVSLSLREKGSEEELVITGEKYCFKPNGTAIVQLIARDEQHTILDQMEVAVRVQLPSSGSGFGLAWKLASSAPGPDHASRRPNGWQRWVEMSRDPVFSNLSLREGPNAQFVLPPSRAVSWEENALPAGDLFPFFPTRIVQVQTSGRAGQWFDIRNALLLKEESGIFRRQRMTALSLRHPRPVPVPPDLQPKKVQISMPDTGSSPITYRRIEWQDPMYNRRLLAVGQEASLSDLILRIDRSQYGAIDLLYPEVIYELNEVIGEGWSIELTTTIFREVLGRPIAMLKNVYSLTAAGVESSADQMNDNDLAERSHQEVGGKLHKWVFEIGLNQQEASDSVMAINFEDKDRLAVEARLKDKDGYEKQHATLEAFIRTEITAWPQPQNAFAIIRHIDGQKDVAAFGWNPKPQVVKRFDRFDPGSWEATFRYEHAFINKGQASVTYEIQPFTPYGEQKMPEPDDL